MQTFPKGADALARVGFAFLAIAVFGGPLFLLWWVRTPYVTGQFVQVAQPIRFDHRHHVVDDGIDCRYCHVDVERSPNTGGLFTTVAYLGWSLRRLSSRTGRTTVTSRHGDGRRASASSRSGSRSPPYCSSWSRVTC